MFHSRIGVYDPYKTCSYCPYFLASLGCVGKHSDAQHPLVCKVLDISTASVSRAEALCFHANDTSMCLCLALEHALPRMAEGMQTSSVKS